MHTRGPHYCPVFNIYLIHLVMSRTTKAEVNTRLDVAIGCTKINSLVKGIPCRLQCFPMKETETVSPDYRNIIAKLIK